MQGIEITNTPKKKLHTISHTQNHSHTHTHLMWKKSLQPSWWFRRLAPPPPLRVKGHTVGGTAGETPAWSGTSPGSEAADSSLWRRKGDASESHLPVRETQRVIPGCPTDVTDDHVNEWSGWMLTHCILWPWRRRAESRRWSRSQPRCWWWLFAVDSGSAQATKKKQQQHHM